MASATSNKSRCATCGKSVGTFMCRGCSQDFCLTHTHEHRQLLSKKIDEEVLFVHNQLQQSFNEHITQPRTHPLMKQIDQWEQDSINKIRQAAEEGRKKLLSIIGKHMDNIKTNLTLFKQEIVKAHDDDDFFESDIKEWKEKLDKLNKDLNAPQAIKIQQSDNVNSFISRISINEETQINETFESLLGDIRIEENGRLLVHGNSNVHTVIRSKGEYSSGQHQFRFKIEQQGSNKWILFAIVSKGAPIQNLPYSTPSTYGWAGSNQVYINGVHHNSHNNYKTDMEMNDILELSVDCDRKKIHLKNERTQSISELDVDIAKCSFPWQINLDVYNANERIRFLP
ncbi:unnamed protein product [Rotaria sp. Silwood2]|nr:unnamed protein product [Rotaria sp. Silwood2]CAF2976445.1 unnamed protein product [Rotaria sp. Silwood2]CAF3278257.1 unnamed protein product [Rotaria sp. Silwood2]CAF4217698.1 unnamed protein product [Rotaria sp. Silwood2]CAF4325657.1 unnamed protein product [Rotaria sp. Silwood2]